MVIFYECFQDLGGRTAISIGSGCDIYMKYVSRAFNMEAQVMAPCNHVLKTELLLQDFSSCKADVLSRGELFTTISSNSRSHIALLASGFIRDGLTVLIHGYSRVVTALLLQAKSDGKEFNVIMTEGRPNADGFVEYDI